MGQEDTMSEHLKTRLQRRVYRLLTEPVPDVDRAKNDIERIRDAWILRGPRWH
jgi:hypothetical protein